MGETAGRSRRGSYHDDRANEEEGGRRPVSGRRPFSGGGYEGVWTIGGGGAAAKSRIPAACFLVKGEMLSCVEESRDTVTNARFDPARVPRGRCADELENKKIVPMLSSSALGGHSLLSFR